MKKTTLILLIVVVLLIGVTGYLYWIKLKKSASLDQSAIQNAGDAAQKITDSATQGVLPSINTQSNPLENAPDINPTSKTNPFSNIKTNPFK
ncbi:MAG: hypothetical protein Athens071426_347 [Parcubacteria group bacterium Athens0714_26]|nr:MAG: hypothetical protein Athens101426_392 [Parcubacteria group bacterium Athens1014_26]TSD02957.1 MAG: hypothetical protein Athens071426_347 [Parcubacteria group bacterium Athens0714_26]